MPENDANKNTLHKNTEFKLFSIIKSIENTTKMLFKYREGKPKIPIHSNNQNAVYLETPFYLKDGHGATSVLQSEFFNEKVALYLMTSIKKAITKKISYNEKAAKIALKTTCIKLPVNDNREIDYEYMERYISEIEEERIKELDSYLKVSHLENYHLTEKEPEILRLYRNNKVTEAHRE